MQEQRILQSAAVTAAAATTQQLVQQVAPDQVLSANAMMEEQRSYFDATAATMKQDRELMLKHLAESFHMPCIVTNQVMTCFKGSGTAKFPFEASAAAVSMGGDLTAALGTKWSHCINTCVRALLLYSQRTVLVIRTYCLT